ncbi:MAG: isoprenylcysteine carboxylmethyltransferase family protein [Anaerolineales bacterium]
MGRKLAFAYSLIVYLVFLGVVVYAIGFVGNLFVPKSVDTGSSSSLWTALLVDLGLVALFALQHSLMARASFKRLWTHLIPKPIERSTFVLFACLALILLFWQWRPLPQPIWDVKLAWARWLLWGLFALGWLLVLAATRMISSGHLFGLSQVREYLRGQPATSPEFQTPGLYRYVRHPLMLGFVIAFWAIPTMTLGHLIYASAMTGFILLGIQFEERALVQRFGDRYREYRKRVPMLIPRLTSPRRLQEQIEKSTVS